jgi:hypothetical protein
MAAFKTLLRAHPSAPRVAQMNPQKTRKSHTHQPTPDLTKK